ncbi:BTAD domain-containing putative transcriptional regulator [Dactylosporangium sp. NPDC049742]|uniref:BTAD domain-containing putative transcriptional regulator n=1 Tax=Dactylosporangium sp. NPDC049742 TaxID=3154737 RepID=UPI0034279313
MIGVDEEFGVLLRAARRAAGLSQRQLAELAGMSLAAVRDLEQGRTRRPQPQSVEALAGGLRLTGPQATAFRLAAARQPAAPAPAVASIRDAAPRQRPARARGGAELPVRVSVLGAAAVHRGAHLVAIGSARQRLLLGRLALSANTAVAVSELVDLLWDVDPPAAPAHAVHTYVSRLRTALDPDNTDRAGLIERTPGGYRLNLTADQLDLAGFRQRVERARAAAPAEALDLLEAALAVWRGSPLADVPQLRHHPLVTAVANERVAVALRFADAALAAGQPGRCLPVLRELTMADPLHEPLHARLIAALAAGDLQAAALAVYADIRRRLVEDLGVEPGPDLIDAHRRVLRQETAGPGPVPAAAPVVPAQLPPDVPGFAGRRAELAELDRIAGTGPAAQPSAVVIAAISGTAGVGKTALAIRWAHRVRDRYPDGQVYVNLRGYDPEEPMSSTDALRRLLRALGVAGADLPADADERAARYRTQIADRRMLILLDNASSVEQVRPLLPGTASCTVLVTSRDRLAGLVAVHGAHRVDLDLLSVVEAGALLRRLIGVRAEAEPGSAVALAELCARLPLALRVVAELVVSRRGATLAELVAELGDQRLRLSLLDAGGDPRGSVPAAFSWSLRHLPPAVAHLFVLVALHPGGDVDVYAAAALADVTVPDARRMLWLLVRGRMLDVTAGERFGMHDLLRAYALGLADDAAAHAARTRLFEHCAAAAAAAMDVLFPAECRHRPAVPPTATTPPLPDRAAARAWLDAELPGLTAVVRYTARHGWPVHAGVLARTLFRYLAGGSAEEALVVHQAAHDAAELAGDRPGAAYADLGLGATQQQLGRLTTAAGHFTRARAVLDQAGDPVGAARALVGLGAVEQRLHRYEVAAGHFGAALAIFRSQRDDAGVGRTLINLGMVRYQLGDFETAAGHHREAIAVHRRIGDRTGEATALTDLGIIEVHLGQPRRAAERHSRSLALFLEAGDRHGEAWARNGLGEAAAAADRPADALAHHTAALDTAVRAGLRDQQARAHAGLGHAHRASFEPDLAREHFARALALYDDLGVPEAAQLRDELAATPD